MRKVLLVVVGLVAAGPALAQGLSLPNLGGSQGGGLGGALGGALGGGQGQGGAGGHSPATLSALQGVFGQQTPEQKRAFCVTAPRPNINCAETTR